MTRAPLSGIGLSGTGLRALVIAAALFLAAMPSAPAAASPGRTLSLDARVKGALSETGGTQTFRLEAPRGTKLALTLSGKLDGLELTLRDPAGDVVDIAGEGGYRASATKIRLKRFEIPATGVWSFVVGGSGVGDFVLKVKGKIAKKWDATVSVEPDGTALLPVAIPARRALVRVHAKAPRGSAAEPRFGTVALVDLSVEGKITPRSHKAYFTDIPLSDQQIPLTNLAGVAGEIRARVRVGGWRPERQRLDLRDDAAIVTDPTANTTTSYEAQKTTFRMPYLFGLIGSDTFNGDFHVVAYADFDGDGDDDCVQSGSDTFSRRRPTFFRQDASGAFVQEDTFLVGGPGLEHPKKILVADFDANGHLDVVILAHGRDRPPFAGETNALYLNDGSRLIYSDRLEQWPGFFHSGAAGDIDNDGDVDVFLGVPHDPFFLMNDGSGGFTEDRGRITADISDFFTSELIDIDRDGYLDLLSGGEEDLTGPPQIVWGSASGRFDERTDLPVVPGFAYVLDADAEDLNGDGLTDLMLTRTGGGTPGGPTFYDGFYVQLLLATAPCEFVAATERIDTPSNWGLLDAGTPDERVVMSEVGDPPVTNSIAGSNWAPMALQLIDVNGDDALDIVELQDYRNGVWLNDGTGRFSAQFVLQLADDPAFAVVR